MCIVARRMRVIYVECKENPRIDDRRSMLAGKKSVRERLLLLLRLDHLLDDLRLLDQECPEDAEERFRLRHIHWKLPGRTAA